MLRFWKGKLFCFLTVYKYTAFCAKWQGNIGGIFSGFVTKCAVSAFFWLLTFFTGKNTMNRGFAYLRRRFSDEMKIRRMKMPELSRFYNIVIKMIYSDAGQHNKPHFHVYFAEYEASVGVDGELLAGSLPVKQLKLVQAWAAIHEDELYAAWNNAVRNIPFGKIEPLR
jgi:hypothetical protein